MTFEDSGALMEVKKKLYAALKAFGPELDFRKKNKRSFTQSREGFMIKFEDGTRMSLTVHRSSEHSAPGEFAAYSNSSVWAGPLYQTILERVPDAKTRFANDQLIIGTSASLVPGRANDYLFTAHDNAEKLASQMIDDIRQFLLPHLTAFVEDYSRAADTLIDGSVAGNLIVRNPFVLGLACLYVSDRFSDVNQLVRTASNNDHFYDYHAAGDDGQPEVADLVGYFSR